MEPCWDIDDLEARTVRDGRSVHAAPRGRCDGGTKAAWRRGDTRARRRARRVSAVRDSIVAALLVELQGEMRAFLAASCSSSANVRVAVVAFVETGVHALHTSASRASPIPDRSPSRARSRSRARRSNASCLRLSAASVASTVVRALLVLRASSSACGAAACAAACASARESGRRRR